MVQRTAQLEEVVLQPEGSTLPASLAKLLDLLPTEIKPNVTQEDVARLGLELLAALNDKRYIRTVYGGLSQYAMALKNFTSDIVHEVQVLTEAADNATAPQAYSLLEHHSLAVDEIIAELYGKTVMATKQVLEAAPAGAFQNSTRAWRASLRNVTQEQASATLSPVLRPQTKNVFDKGETFCARFLTSMRNHAVMNRAIAGVIPGLRNTMEMLPLIGGSIKTFAPGSEDEVMKLVNTSLDAMSKSLYGVEMAVYIMKKGMMEVASHSLNCTAPPVQAKKAGATGLGEETVRTDALRSGAATHGGRVGLVAAAMTAALAWMSA
eukprot:CAMPEP_0175744090 /NCGR_PEP_ID=MMETSP0097-20121207/57367_1 /TAXON_ID=311494 /ORGANISM="Alexandrium monilatum, Strain CCMP3105" /LENGTH=321 /DNA_ID=CAMNT_0017052427 /DNA_START=9 /DNA_END=974 /DNA_ORIENTATION=-